MSYHFLGDVSVSASASVSSGSGSGPTSDDLANPNSSYWLGPRCSGGQSAREVLEYQLFSLCQQHGAGTAQPDDNTVNPVLGKANTWSKSGRCTGNGARVRAEATCGVIGSSGLASQAVTSASYSPPGSTPPAPPLPTQKCPNGPPQPQGKCCPAGYVGTAPVCTPVEVAKTLTLAQLMSGQYAAPISSFTGPAGRPGPVTQPKPVTIFDPSAMASGGGGLTTFNTSIFQPAPKPSLPPAVAIEDQPSTTASPASKERWVLAAMIGVAVVSVGAMGWAYYSSR